MTTFSPSWEKVTDLKVHFVKQMANGRSMKIFVPANLFQGNKTTYSTISVRINKIFQFLNHKSCQCWRQRQHVLTVSPSCGQPADIFMLLKGSSVKYMNASQKSCHKSPKSGIMCLTKMYQNGPCKGAAGRKSISCAAPLHGPCGTLARTLCGTISRTRVHLVKHVFHFWAIFDPTEP